MASPQKENGYTAIANEIMESLCRTRVPGEARQILDTILRKTYGWNKKEDAISLSQFVELTGLNKVHVCRSIDTLIKMNLITKKGNAKSIITQKGNVEPVSYSFNKDFETWNALPKKVTLPKKVITVTQKGNSTLPILGTTKDIIKQNTKDNYMFDAFWRAYPKKIGKQAASKAWSKIKTQGEVLIKILSALKWQKELEQWNKEGGQYIPNPATYLNQGRWEDERPAKHSGIGMMCRNCHKETHALVDGLCWNCKEVAQ